MYNPGKTSRGTTYLSSGPIAHLREKGIYLPPPQVTPLPPLQFFPYSKNYGPQVNIVRGL